MFERFTDGAKLAVRLAALEARQLNHNYIGTEHILLGLIDEGEGIAADALESLDVSLEAVRSLVEQIIGRGRESRRDHIPFTPRAKKVLELSLREALQLHHTYIGTEHILLGLIREGEGVAAQVLLRLGTDLNEVPPRVVQLLTATPPVAAVGPQPGLETIWADAVERSITRVRREKESAIDRQDFEAAASRREQERALVAVRTRVAGMRPPTAVDDYEPWIRVFREAKRSAFSDEDIETATEMHVQERDLIREYRDAQRETARAAGERALVGAGPAAPLPPASHPVTGREIFISYSHQDRAWLERLNVHLRPLVRSGDVEVWDDRKIEAGDQWKDEVTKALIRAKFAILLVSANFLASDFVYHEELPALLAAAAAGGCRVIPVLVSPSLFAHTPSLSRFQAVNSPERPLISLSEHEQEAVLAKVALTIMGK